LEASIIHASPPHNINKAINPLRNAMPGFNGMKANMIMVMGTKVHQGRKAPLRYERRMVRRNGRKCFIINN
jgi:hypothetical protein